MLYQHTKIAVIFLAALTFLSPTANADVIPPALDIDDLGAGDFISRTGNDFTINGTAFALITDFGPPLTAIDITDVDFVLNTTFSSTNGIDYIFTGGTVTAGSYINTTVTTLSISESFGFASFFADFADGGRIEGGFILNGDLSGDFTGSLLTAKAGPVVPVPAAVWLFGSGLLGLVGVARRKKAAA